MPAITQTVTLRIPPGLLAGVDEVAAAYGFSRNAALVHIVEIYLRERQVPAVEQASGLAESGRLLPEAESPSGVARFESRTPMPAEQPEVFRQRDLVQTREGPTREFRPYPKGKP
jgi:hypothetical protein